MNRAVKSSDGSGLGNGSCGVHDFVRDNAEGNIWGDVPRRLFQES